MVSFQVELKPGYYLEARPHAYTEDDKPVYTRTGKVAKKVFAIIDLSYLTLMIFLLFTNECLLYHYLLFPIVFAGAISRRCCSLSRSHASIGYGFVSLCLCKQNIYHRYEKL